MGRRRPRPSGRSEKSAAPNATALGRYGARANRRESGSWRWRRGRDPPVGRLRLVETAILAKCRRHQTPLLDHVAHALTTALLAAIRCTGAFRLGIAAGASSTDLLRGGFLAILHRAVVRAAIAHRGHQLGGRPGRCNRPCHQRQGDQHCEKNGQAAHGVSPLDGTLPPILLMRRQLSESARRDRAR